MTGVRSKLAFVIYSVVWHICVGLFFWGWAIKNMVNGHAPFDSGVVIFFLSMCTGVLGLRIWWAEADGFTCDADEESTRHALDGQPSPLGSSSAAKALTGQQNRQQNRHLQNGPPRCRSRLVCWYQWMLLLTHLLITVIYAGAGIAIKRPEISWWKPYCLGAAAAWLLTGIAFFLNFRRLYEPSWC